MTTLIFSVTLENFKPTLVCNGTKNRQDNIEIDTVELYLPVEKFIVSINSLITQQGQFWL